MPLTSSIEDTGKLSNEQGETNADWSKEGAFVLLSREHENREDKLGGQKHLDD